MKNEVKKKMMIDLRKSCDQSYCERVFGSKSQEVFPRVHGVARDFRSANAWRLALCGQSEDKKCARSVQHATCGRMFCRDPFSHSCIYNEDRETFAGA
jgi:hypothetical protein